MKTQGRTVIAALRKRALTYREMLNASASCTPWKRVKESLGADEQIVVGRRGQWTTWRVIKSTGWTA